MAAPGSRADIEMAVSGAIVAAARQVLQSTPPDRSDLLVLAAAVDLFDAYQAGRDAPPQAAEPDPPGPRVAPYVEEPF